MSKKPKVSRWAWVVALPALVAIIGSVQGGSLEPTGSPGPTMKTLDEIPPTWSQVLPASQRFVLVMGGAAVLDKETGLVWEKSPSATFVTWSEAQFHCNDLSLVNRMGWRLPTIQELTSLADRTENSGLPGGHPFTDPPLVGAWSATTNASDSTTAWMVLFGLDVYVGNGASKIIVNRAWCVRGGTGLDAQ